MGVAMKKLNEELLAPGDIILVTARDKLNKAIKLGTKSDISHALIYVQQYSVIDATDDGVQARNTQRLYYEADCPLYALRLRETLTSAQLDTIVRYVRERIGSEYSVGEAVRSVLGGGKDFTRKQFCSRLVAQAYAAAGITLVADPNYCSPADLKASALLHVIDGAFKHVDEHEAEFFARTPDLSEAMREATNNVLTGVRALGGDIQSLSDVTEFVVKHPEHDQAIAELYQSSGYMDVWRIEVERNPERYDVALFASHPADDEGKAGYCRVTLADVTDAQPSRYVQNLAYYVTLSKHYKRSTFVLLQGLYEHLVQLDETRTEVARTWLASRSQA